MRHTRLSQGGNTLVGIAAGLLIGVLIAAAIALYISFGKKPFADSKPDKTTPPPTSASAPAANSSGPIALPGKPGGKPIKTDYDFYKILPGGESAPAPTPASAPAPTADPTVPEKVWLQAGAFQDATDADNLRARLALMGLEAGIQRIDTADKGVLQRVRIGPFANSEEANATRANLAQEGIETVVVRPKRAAPPKQP